MTCHGVILKWFELASGLPGGDCQMLLGIMTWEL